MGGGTKSILVYHVIPKGFLVTWSATLKAFHLYGGSSGKSPLEKPKTLRPFFFLRVKETKKPALCHLSKWVLLSCSRLKIIKGQVVFFEKSIQKISTFKPLIIFILSVSVCLPKAVLSKNKILSSFGWIA